MRSKTVTVAENHHVQDNLFQLHLPFDGKAKAGQFVMVRDSHSCSVLPRALSVCDVREGQLVLVYQAVGKGTTELSRLKAGDSVTLTGPIGQGFPTETLTATSRVALVGGGVGTAPLLLTARQLAEKNVPVDIHLGFQDKTMLTRELEPLCHHLHIATESGSHGVKGLVTATLDRGEYDVVFCCGPTPMMEAVSGYFEPKNVPVYLSLEQKMACGMGACLSCTCTDPQGKNHRTCVEGPVFLSTEVNFHA